MAEDPWFKWYPKDFETDERVRLMTDEELGFYVRCLNHAWLNRGLPAEANAEQMQCKCNANAMQRIFGVSQEHLFSVWEKVGECFVLEGNRLINKKQESLRLLKNKLSRIRSQAAKRRSICSAIAQQTPIQTSGSGSGSISSSSKSSLPQGIDDGSRFEKFWQRYPNKVGKQMACQMWISLVDDSDAVFEGLERWEKSSQWHRGAIERPENWISKRMWLDEPIPAESNQKSVNYAPCAQCGASMVAVGGKCPECGTERTEGS